MKLCIELKKNKKPCVLHLAILKYGIENFKIELILTNILEEDIDELEKYYIKKYNSYFKNNQGYNMTEGGQGIHGYKHTKETKELISKLSKHYWIDLKQNNIEEYNRLCKLRSSNLKGIKRSEESKIKYSQSALKNTLRDDYINPFKGKRHCQKTKDIISEKNGYKVGMFDIKTNSLIKEFRSCELATQYLLEQGLTTNKSAKSRILYVCDVESRSAYGYKWRRLN